MCGLAVFRESRNTENSMQIFSFLTKSVNILERFHLVYNWIVNVCKFTTATETALYSIFSGFLSKGVAGRTRVSYYTKLLPVY